MSRLLWALTLSLLTLLASCSYIEEKLGNKKETPSGSTQPTENGSEDASISQPVYIKVARRDALLIGQKIWMNEGSAKIESLTSWNAGEGFASLGIGHFIWYPAGKEGPFIETFPDLIDFLLEKRIVLPAILLSTRDCPWQSKAAFQHAFNSADMVQLRKVLRETMAEQVQFIINRLAKALPAMQATLSLPAQRAHIEKQFHRLAALPNGVYALIDYVNFKGEGISPNERYNDIGWGLLQALESMTGNTNDPLSEFRSAATYVLQRRVRNAPVARNEGRWLMGWQKRINTYR